jgi:hypothetical protein
VTLSEQQLSLSAQQRLFSKLLGAFLVWIDAHGYEVVGGDWHRTQAQADANEAAGSGITHSLHTISLACDLMLFIDGIYQTETPPYKPLGDYWKTLHPLCRWGGDFSKPDGDHFSMEWDGIR